VPAAAAPAAVDSSGGAGGLVGAGAVPDPKVADADGGVEPDVKQIIDHIDRELS
jgi:hypothetical protein